jgi:hypothetical protein
LSWDVKIPDIQTLAKIAHFNSRRESMKRNCILIAALCLVVLSLAQVASAQDAKVAGSWDLSAPGRDGNITTQTLTLQQDGTKLTGTMKGQRGEAPVAGTISGSNISFSVTRTTPNGDVKIDYTGTVSGDAMKGTLTVMGNNTEWTAKRTAGGGSGN